STAWGYRTPSFVRRGDEVHVLHAMAGRLGELLGGLDHLHLGAADRAAVAQVDPAQLTLLRWIRRMGDRPQHEQARAPHHEGDGDGDEDVQQRAHRASDYPRRSMMVALAIPPPSHIVCRPKRPPVRSNSHKSVVISRAPEQPSGWT